MSSIVQADNEPLYVVSMVFAFGMCNQSTMLARISFVRQLRNLDLVIPSKLTELSCYDRIHDSHSSDTLIDSRRSFSAMLLIRSLLSSSWFLLLLITDELMRSRIHGTEGQALIERCIRRANVRRDALFAG